MTLDESTDENDVVRTSGAVKVAYMRTYDEYLNDVMIDYKNKWYNRGFRMSGNRIGNC